MRLKLLSALLFLLLAAPLAHADNLSFAYNDGTNIGTGTLTLDANYFATGGTFTLTSGPSTGSYTLVGNPGHLPGLSIFAPDGFDIGFDDSVRILTPAPLDVDGLGFIAVGSTITNSRSSGTVLNLYEFAGTYELDAANKSIVEGAAGSNFLTFAPAVAATPEPSSLVLLSTGIVAAAGVVRRRLLTV